LGTVAEGNSKSTSLSLAKLGLAVTLLTDDQQAVEAITLGAQKPRLIRVGLHLLIMDGYTTVT
jgi:CheY-like chemotaxis protein